MTTNHTGDLRERLERCLAGPYADAYRRVAERLDRFSATAYPITADGARGAVCELLELTAEIKRMDDQVAAAKRAALEPYLDDAGVQGELRSYIFDLVGLS